MCGSTLGSLQLLPEDPRDGNLRVSKCKGGGVEHARHSELVPLIEQYEY